MGCCYSYEEEDDHVVPEPSARSVYARTELRRPTPTATSSYRPRPGARYGEYKCGCGYFWVSRLSWPDKYQQCKRCKAPVRPRNQRELRPTDFTRGGNDAHPQDLCEMCKQVGGYCGKNK